MRVRRDVARVQLAFIHQGLHVGIVLGDLLELAVAQQVAPGISHVADAEIRAVEEHGGQRGAHAFGFWMRLDVVTDGLVGLVGGRFQQGLGVFLARILVQNF